MEAAAAEAPGRVEGAAAVAASDHTRAELDRSLVDWQADRSNDFELEANMLVGLGFVWERWLGLWLARRLENAPARARPPNARARAARSQKNWDRPLNARSDRNPALSHECIQFQGGLSWLLQVGTVSHVQPGKSSINSHLQCHRSTIYALGTTGSLSFRRSSSSAVLSHAALSNPRLPLDSAINLADKNQCQCALPPFL